MMSRIVKKCSSGRVVLGQFIPVERQNRLASPSNDRINSGVLFLEIARLPRDRIRTNRTQQVRILTFLRTQRNIRDMQHPNVDGDCLQHLFEIRLVVAKIVSVSRIAAVSMVIILRIYAPHEYGRAPTPSPTACLHELVGGGGGSEFARRLALPPTNSNAALIMSTIYGNEQFCRGAGA